MAVLIVHEFMTEKTSDAKHAANATDYFDFVNRLAGSASVTGSALLSSFRVPGSPLFEDPPPLIVGKLVTDCRQT